MANLLTTSEHKRFLQPLHRGPSWVAISYGDPASPFHEDGVFARWEVGKLDHPTRVGEGHDWPLQEFEVHRDIRLRCAVVVDNPALQHAVVRSVRLKDER